MDAYTEHCAAPPGEEGFDISHEGGEYEAFEGLSEQVASLSHVCYVDACTRHDHIELQTEHWHNHIDRLVDSYLDYRLRDGGDGMPSVVDAAPAVEGSDCPTLTDIDCYSDPIIFPSDTAFLITVLTFDSWTYFLTHVLLPFLIITAELRSLSLTSFPFALFPF
ncbi:hypothetical protein CY34DRAFT_88259 [Suillus luteus UH-Slu-Lm8-n1]|uniref:Uncharacterized protein n=1 Tax=Suillus luteus UH-Slu-Lm8-n1 TaxID=930992 RepID=A0A0D0B081_9AGAM|nr:hypothetical protein CY34DRAFT_88259 [Suillus luteus UH-Slu-Lm8-n1]